MSNPETFDPKKWEADAALNAHRTNSSLNEEGDVIAPIPEDGMRQYLPPTLREPDQKPEPKDTPDNLAA